MTSIYFKIPFGKTQHNYGQSSKIFLFPFGQIFFKVMYFECTFTKNRTAADRKWQLYYTFNKCNRITLKSTMVKAHSEGQILREVGTVYFNAINFKF